MKYYSLYNYKIKLMHNPQLAIIGFLKKKFPNFRKKVSGDILFKVDEDDKLFSAGLIGILSDDIIDVICKRFYLIPSFLIKLFLNIFKDRIFVANCFLPNNLSNSYMTLFENQLSIDGSYKKEYYQVEKKIKQKIKVSFSKFSFLSFFYRMPIGSDIHYTGTVNKENHKNFSLNHDYSLEKDSNIFVIDGSVLNGNPIYPGLHIINNSIDFLH